MFKVLLVIKQLTPNKLQICNFFNKKNWSTMCLYINDVIYKKMLVIYVTYIWATS